MSVRPRDLPCLSSHDMAAALNLVVQPATWPSLHGTDSRDQFVPGAPALPEFLALASPMPAHTKPRPPACTREQGVQAEPTHAASTAPRL
eukprot:365607-Chlamydomonas_euryale.AAC.12